MHDELFVKLRKSALVNGAGLPYMEVRKTLTPKWGMVWSHIALGWMALVLTNLVIILLSGRQLAIDLVLVGGDSILIGFLIAYLQLFLHEAAHYNLHQSRKMNDLLCNVFVSGIVGQEVKNYRPIHWDHHRYLGTPMDSDGPKRLMKSILPPMTGLPITAATVVASCLSTRFREIA